MKKKEKKFAEYIKRILESKGEMKLNYLEVTTEEAIEMLRTSNSKKVLVAIQNLEDGDDEIVFCRWLKSECESIIQEAKTITSMCDDFVKKLDLYTEQQKDLYNIQPHGLQKTILLQG